MKIRLPEPPAAASGDPSTWAPAKAVSWAVLVHGLAAMILGWQATAGKLLLNERSDQYIAGYAFRDFARAFWEDFGQIPQWNPFLYGGMPFVDAMHGDTFYPTAWLRILLGTGPGMTWGMIIHIFLAGLFTWFFLRSLGLSFFAALVGGVAYQMGGNVAGLVSPGHDGKIFVATMLPLALYFVVRGIRDGNAWAWGPLALTVGLGVLSPHPQLLQYMLLLTGAFAVFVAFGGLTDDASSVLPRGVGLRRLAASLGAVGLGMLMGAIQFLPVMRYTPWSPRAGGIAGGYEAGVSYSMPPEETLNFALPEFSGILDAYWGRNPVHFHSEYIGIVVLLFAAAAFGHATRASHRRAKWFFVGALVVSWLWAMGGFTPFYRLVWAIVPGTKFFRAPSTMLFIVSFAISVLAAFGIDRTIRGGLRRTFYIATASVVALLTVLAVSGALANFGLSINPNNGQRVLANEAAVAAGALRMLLFAALGLGAIYLVSTRRLSRDLAGAMLVALVAADLWSVVRRYWIFEEPATLYPTDPAIEYLQKQAGPFRIATLPSNTANDLYLYPLRDGLMVHRIAVTTGYHGNHMGTYDRLLGGEGLLPPSLGNPNFWRLNNLRYFVTADSVFPVPGSERVLGPVQNGFGNTVYIHKLPGEFSYAWIVPAAVKSGKDEAAATILDPRFDVTRVALFDSTAAVEPVSFSQLPEALPIRVRTTAWRAGSATLELDGPAPKGSALVVSENFYPGWRATVDGADVPVGLTNAALIGIALPEGARKVEIAFENAPYQTGRSITWSAVALAALLSLAGIVISRRQVARV